MTARDHNRKTEAKTEGIVSLLTLLILLPVLLFVYWGHASGELPANALYINDGDMTAEKVTQALGVKADTAQRLMEERARRGGFDSVDQIAHSRKLNLTEAEARTVQGRVLVRHSMQVWRNFVLVTLFFILAIFFAPIWLRAKAGVDGDPFLVPMLLLLCGLGVAMLFSLKDPLRDPAAYLHHAQGVFLSLLALLFAARITPAARQKIRRIQYVWVLFSLALVAALFLFGRGPEGVKLNLFGFFQPVEAIKLMLVFFLAGYLADRAGLIADVSQAWTPFFASSLRGSDGKPLLAFSMPRRQDMGPVVVMFALALVMFYVVKDLGPGLLLFATFMATLYLTTGKGSFIGIGIALIFAVGVFGYWRHIGVFGTRVDMWLHPFANTHPNGMQLGQAYWALASGGWEGSGLGLGMPNLIPRGQDDLAFISWTEETGFFGAWLVLIVLACLVWRGMRLRFGQQTSSTALWHLDYPRCSACRRS